MFGVFVQTLKFFPRDRITTENCENQAKRQLPTRFFFATFVHLCIFSCLFWALNGSFNIMCVVFHVLFLHQTLYTPSWSRQRLWPGRSKLVHDVGVYKWIALKKKIVLALDFCILHICSTEIWLLAPGKTVQMNHTHVSATINHCLLIEFQYISCR